MTYDNIARPSRRLRALQAGIRTAIRLGDTAMASRMTTLHDAVAMSLSGTHDPSAPDSEAGSPVSATTTAEMPP